MPASVRGSARSWPIRPRRDRRHLMALAAPKGSSEQTFPGAVTWWSSASTCSPQRSRAGRASKRARARVVLLRGSVAPLGRTSRSQGGCASTTRWAPCPGPAAVGAAQMDRRDRRSRARSDRCVGPGIARGMAVRVPGRHPNRHRAPRTTPSPAGTCGRRDFSVRLSRHRSLARPVRGASCRAGRAARTVRGVRGNPFEDYRRVLIRGFPYMAVYRVGAEHLEVLLVVGTRRDRVDRGHGLG